MIALTATTHSLELNLSAALATDYQASFVDTTTTDYTPGSNQGTTSSSGDITNVVAAPASSTYRKILQLTVTNKDGSSSQTVTVMKDVSGTEYTLFKAVLLAGETLQYQDGRGFATFDANGVQKVNNSYGITLGTGVAALLQKNADGSDDEAIGTRGVPFNSQTGNYTLVLADSGLSIVHPSGAGSGDTFTIPANGSVAFPVGTAITFLNLASDDLSIAITTDTMTLADSTTTGTRTLAQNGVATAIKTTSTGWLISGTGLS